MSTVKILAPWATSLFNPFKRLPNSTDAAAEAYRTLVVHTASVLVARQLRAKGMESAVSERNAERSIFAAAATVHYDQTRDPYEYAKPIADAVMRVMGA